MFWAHGCKTVLEKYMNNVYHNLHDPWWVRRASGIDQVVKYLGILSIGVGVVVLAVLTGQAVLQGLPRLHAEFFTSFPSRVAAQAGILSAWVGTIWVVVLCACMSVPLGIMTAIYLEEYSGKRLLSRILEINIANLAGVPSIIYGLLGLGLFVRFLSFGRSVLAGAATLALLILPIVILATREALRAVPHSLREGSYALGARRCQTM